MYDINHNILGFHLVCMGRGKGWGGGGNKLLKENDKLELYMKNN